LSLSESLLRIAHVVELLDVARLRQEIEARIFDIETEQREKAADVSVTATDIGDGPDRRSLAGRREEIARHRGAFRPMPFILPIKVEPGVTGRWL
jgi:hypothetical protein